MRCFNNGKQKLSSSDRTYDLKSTVIFNHNLELYEDENNFDGTFCYDSNGVKKAHSYDLLYSNTKGEDICDPSCIEIKKTLFPDKPDTPFGTYTVMTLPSTSKLVDISCNYVKDSSCNMSRSSDGTSNTWTAEAHGEYSIIDPINVLLGTGCVYKKYMNYVDISGNSHNF